MALSARWYDRRTKPVGGGLQRRDVVDSNKGIVGLVETDLPPLQLLFDETVPIEVIARLEREEGGYPHHDRTEDLIADVEVVVREAAALVRQDPVIWIFGRVFRHGDAKGGALLHALEDEIDAVGAPLRHVALPGQDVIFLAHPLLGPLDRQPMITGKGFHPGLVVGGALAEDLLVDRGDADDVAEEVHHLLGSRQAAQVTVYDDAIEAVVDEGQQIAEQLGEQFHGSPPKTHQGSETKRARARPADYWRQGFSSGR